MASTPIVIQQQPPQQQVGYGSQILVGALAGVLAWWLIETISSARKAGAESDDDE